MIMKKIFFATLIILQCGLAYAQTSKEAVKSFIEANKTIGPELSLVNKMVKVNDLSNYGLFPIDSYKIKDITFVYHNDWLELKGTSSSSGNRFALLIRYENITYMKAYQKRGIMLFFSIS